MRYRGQGWEIPVAIPEGRFDEVAADSLLTEFTKTYERFFGRAIEGLAIEAVSWAVRVASMTDTPDRVERHDPGEVITPTATRPLHDPVSGETVDGAVIERNTLAIGDTVAGPAVIVEEQTTTVLGAHHLAVVQGDQSIRVMRSKGASS